MSCMYLFSYFLPCPIVVQGFGSWLQAYKGKDPFDADGLGWCAGISTEQKPAFNEPSDERKAETQIDTFMRDVLLPLAAETRAVVVTSAVPAMCQLSASFLRMFTAKRSTWAAKCPFTILSGKKHRCCKLSCLVLVL